jgi:hypothetical protein
VYGHRTASSRVPLGRRVTGCASPDSLMYPAPEHQIPKRPSPNQGRRFSDQSRPAIYESPDRVVLIGRGFVFWEQLGGDRHGTPARDCGGLTRVECRQRARARLPRTAPRPQCVALPSRRPERLAVARKSSLWYVTPAVLIWALPLYVSVCHASQLGLPQRFARADATGRRAAGSDSTRCARLLKKRMMVRPYPPSVRDDYGLGESS